MLEVALGGFDEIGDKIVAALELDVDLGEGVFEAVAQGDEAVVNGDGPQAEDHEEKEQNTEDDEGGHDVKGISGCGTPESLRGSEGGARRKYLQRG